MVTGPAAQRLYRCRCRRRAGEAHERQGRCIDATRPLAAAARDLLANPPPLAVSGVEGRSCSSNGRVAMPGVDVGSHRDYSQPISAELTEIVVVILEPDNTPM